MNVLKSIVKWFVPKEKQYRTLDHLNNQLFLDILVKQFTEDLEDFSVGDRMLYPMSFNILLHKNDYAQLEMSLPFVLPQVVNSFYRVIEKYSDRYPDFTFPATDWFFQITSCEMRPDNIPIEESSPVVLASLLTLDLQKASQMDGELNIRSSYRAVNSEVNRKMNINKDAILSMDIRAAGVVTIPPDYRKINAANKRTDVGRSSIRKYATLTYSTGTVDFHYDMKEKSVFISGNADTRNQNNILKLNSNDVIVNHLQIRFLEEEDKFQMAVFAPTRVNGRELELSGEGVLKWYDLSNHSSILLNDSVCVKFETSQL